VRNDAVLTSRFVIFYFSAVVLSDDSGRRKCDAVSLGGCFATFRKKVVSLTAREEPEAVDEDIPVGWCY